MPSLRTTLVLATLLMSLHVSGQSIQTDFDKKVIYTDSLNLPRNTSADALLYMLPELVQRPGDLVLNNYDVKIEGMSIGAAADVALANLQIVDIEKVEVSESPMSSYQNNGQGGSINFVLRSGDADRKDKWGSVGVLLATSGDVSPQLVVGSKNDKFKFHGVLMGELYNSTNDNRSVTFDNGQFASQSNSAVDKKFRTELARVYMQYNFSSKDVLKFNLSEIYMYKKTFTETDYGMEKSVMQRQNSVDLTANLNYQHGTARSKFTAEIKYNYTPNHNYNEVQNFYINDSRQKSNSLSGKLEYKNVFLKTTSERGVSKQADVTFGSNFNGNLSHEDAKIIDNGAVGPAQRHLPRNNTYYLMPYLTLSGSFGKFRVKASGEFQHFRYNIERNGETYSAISNDFTGKLMAEWHFTGAQNLRLILDRKLKRPSADQLYPNRIFVPAQRAYVEGNPDLLPTMVHQVALDYISNRTWNTFNNIIFNVSASISSIDDIINSKRPTQPSNNGPLGLVQDYITYENNGTSKVASANLMTLYTYKAFSLSFAGNMYYKMSGSENNNKHLTYYNFSVYPHFKLKDGWNGGARFIYYSRIDQTDGYTGDAAISCMTVGKAWKKFFVYLIEDVALNKEDIDVKISGTKRTEKRYNLVQSFVGVGMKFTF